MLLILITCNCKTESFTSCFSNLCHFEIEQDSYKNCVIELLQETRGTWPDLLLTVLSDEWKKCKRGIKRHQNDNWIESFLGTEP